MYHVKKVPKELHDGLYRQLEFLHNFFIENKITYWINGGTLLGAFRENRIILWDDDADIGIFESDKEIIINNLRPWAIKNGYQLWNSVHGFELREKAKDFTIKTDIFLYTLSNNNGQNRFVLASDRSRKAWPYDYFLPNELENIVIKQIGQVSVNMIKDPTRYLTDVYGNDFMTHMYLDFNHITGKPHTDKGIKHPISNIVISDD